MQDFGVRFLMTRTAAHDSGPSTIDSPLDAHRMRFSFRAEHRRFTRHMTIHASRASENGRRFLKGLK
jgi:hypothetical protein